MGHCVWRRVCRNQDFVRYNVINEIKRFKMNAYYFYCKKHVEMLESHKNQLYWRIS